MGWEKAALAASATAAPVTLEIAAIFALALMTPAPDSTYNHNSNNHKDS
jgi:hypothetical protein